MLITDKDGMVLGSSDKSRIGTLVSSFSWSHFSS
ncbi:hypothetical protein ACFX4I_21990 [Peribacillus sp. YIM B13472]